MGATAARQLLVLGQGRSQKPALSSGTHHPRLGSGRPLPYSADGGKKPESRHPLDELKQQIPLLDYLQAHDWRPARQLSRGRLMGLCPLHEDHQPSLLLDPHKNLFYCYGCGRGGDVIRFAELYHQVSFPQALSLLHQWRGLAPLLDEVASFYRMHVRDSDTSSRAGTFADNVLTWRASENSDDQLWSISRNAALRFAPMSAVPSRHRSANFLPGITCWISIGRTCDS